MNITVIGSFKKYYGDICDLIDLMSKHGVRVLSPKKSRIVENIEGFVILESDDRNCQPYVIQENVFDNIRKSNYVYVWNPGGYLGNSTCYEIGKIIGMEIPLFFKESPKDLPLKVDDCQIKSPSEFIEYLLHEVSGKEKRPLEGNDI